jgi:tetratricopeptide (TPR) repeat protein
LDSASYEAHKQLGRTLSYYASEAVEGPQRLSLLAESAKELEAAASILGQYQPDILSDLGGVSLEQGDFDEAIQYFERARGASRGEVAAGLRKEEDWDITYDLACVLAQQRAFAEAYRELQGILHVPRYRDLVRQDADFQAMRENAEWGAKLNDLLDRR